MFHLTQLQTRGLVRSRNLFPVFWTSAAFLGRSHREIGRNGEVARRDRKRESSISPHTHLPSRTSYSIFYSDADTNPRGYPVIEKDTCVILENSQSFNGGSCLSEWKDRLGFQECKIKLVSAIHR